jgi:DNA invertase Pin-like site-specific DNA recombinase
LFLRVSGKAQVEGDGFTRQLEAIRRYAAGHDMKIVRVYRYEGVSGTKDLENRPAFVDMMTALHSNGTKLVLVEKLDRQARDLMVQETMIGDLRRNGLELVSVMEPDLLQDDPSRKLVCQIFGAIVGIREDHDRAQAPRRPCPCTRKSRAL